MSGELEHPVFAVNAIEVDGVTKVYRLYASPRDRLREVFSGRTYHHQFYALRDVSLTVGRGQTVGIIGQNGSGKSTLLKLISGVSRPTKGSIRVNGTLSSLLELGAGFNPEFTGRDNVYMNGALMGLSRQQMDRRFEDIEAFANIGEFIDQPVRTYSSGMYIRLAFACTVNVGPDIIVVDEALAVGDTRFQLKCFLKLQELQEKGKTILFVSHDLNTIKKYCSEAVVLNKGEVIFKGTPNEAVNLYTMILSAEDSDDVRQANHGSRTTSEYRYGSEGGEITQVGTYDSQGRPTPLFETGEEMRVVYRAIARRNVARPLFGMTVKDVKGQDVYVTNTLYQGISVPALSEGMEVEVAFSQKLSLIPGSYFVSVGFVEVDQGRIVPIDRRYDVMEIKVTSKGDDSSTGIANLDSRISVKQVTLG